MGCVGRITYLARRAVTVRRTATKTRKRFSVVFAAWDPPTPVIVKNTNFEATARATYRAWKRIMEHEELQGPSGEWSLTLYEHTPDTTLVVHKADSDAPFYERPFVYNLLYRGSKELESFSYMETARSRNSAC